MNSKEEEYKFIAKRDVGHVAGDEHHLDLQMLNTENEAEIEEKDGEIEEYQAEGIWLKLFTHITFS